jgi:Protein of unknown function (DUF1580)
MVCEGLPVSTTTVISEIADGKGLSLAQAAKRFSSYRGNRPCNPSTVFRWVSNGVVTRNGQRVRLEPARLNGRYLTTAAAIARFISAQTLHTQDDDARVASSTQTRRRASQTAQELDKLGL